MKVLTGTLEVETRGHTHIIDLTRETKLFLEKTRATEGFLTLFVPGSTAALSTIEYEPGLLKDLSEILEKLAPSGRRYHHDDTWGDGNGYAHIRAALLGPSLSIPFKNKELLVGTWQQIILVDFDNRPRKRKIIIQIVGE